MKLQLTLRIAWMLMLTACVAFGLSSPATARTQLKNICRVKGQEENVLRGLGLVVGLNGTGEANDGPADDGAVTSDPTASTAADERGRS